MTGKWQSARNWASGFRKRTYLSLSVHKPSMADGMAGRGEPFLIRRLLILAVLSHSQLELVDLLSDLGLVAVQL